jgi:hypothetical protein
MVDHCGGWWTAQQSVKREPAHVVDEGLTVAVVVNALAVGSIHSDWYALPPGGMPTGVVCTRALGGGMQIAYRPLMPMPIEMFRTNVPPLAID